MEIRFTVAECKNWEAAVAKAAAFVMKDFPILPCSIRVVVDFYLPSDADHNMDIDSLLASMTGIVYLSLEQVDMTLSIHHIDDEHPRAEVCVLVDSFSLIKGAGND